MHGGRFVITLGCSVILLLISIMAGSNLGGVNTKILARVLPKGEAKKAWTNAARRPRGSTWSSF